MGTEADIAQAETGEAAPAAVESTRIALRTGASVTPDDIDGYCENGVGVYLNATRDTAELTVYVVAPAESAVFDRPALRLTTQQGDSQATEVMEFETIELQAGESRVFAQQAAGTLMDVFAEVSAE